MSILRKVVGLISPNAESDADGAHFAVMSPSDARDDEGKIAVRLLENGLTTYHFRRQQWTAGQYKNWIKRIPEEFRSRIILHRHAQLVRECGLGGFFCPKEQYSDLPRKIAGCLLTRAEDYSSLLVAGKICDKILFGPVFRSKKSADSPPQRTMREYGATLAYWRKHGGKAPVLAFGGINEKNIHECRVAGFNGVIVVGAVWGAEDPVKALKKLIQKW